MYCLTKVACVYYLWSSDNHRPLMHASHLSSYLLMRRPDREWSMEVHLHRASVLAAYQHWSTSCDWASLIRQRLCDRPACDASFYLQPQDGQVSYQKRAKILYGFDFWCLEHWLLLLEANGVQCSQQHSRVSTLDYSCLKARAWLKSLERPLIFVS